MNLQPDRIVFVTERPLQIASIRQLLECSGLLAELSVVLPSSLQTNLLPSEACLVVLDGDARQPWEWIGRARRQGQSRFVLLMSDVTPGMIHIALSAGIHGVLSTGLPLEEVCVALRHIWQGESQFRFGGAHSEDAPGEEQVTYRVTSGTAKLAVSEATAW
jgi:hypothetical protein